MMMMMMMTRDKNALEYTTVIMPISGKNCLPSQTITLCLLPRNIISEIIFYYL